MQAWSSIDQVLDYAIREEEAAAEFYTQLAEQTERPAMRQALESFAQEELRHKQRLLAIKGGGAASGLPLRRKPRGIAAQPVADLRLADYLVEMVPSPFMSYRELLVVAMHKEKAAFKLYTDLAAGASDDQVRATFLSLAQEEARHKLHFEIEYDDTMTEN
jgi:rubrerythrin